MAQISNGKAEDQSSFVSSELFFYIDAISVVPN